MLLRSLTTLALAGIAYIGACAADDGIRYKELLREDFSLFTAGSENRPSANPVCDNLQYIPETKTLTPGWQGVEIYQAGGMAYQGSGGRLFTPDIDLSQNGGTFRVSFRMKLANGSPEGYASIVHSNISAHMGDKLTNEWQTIEFELSGGVKNDYICIRGISSAETANQSKVKVLIDDILIEVPDPDLETPTAVTYSEFDGTSFSAHWHAVDAAEKYELRLYTLGVSGLPDYIEGSYSTDKTSYHFSELDENWSGYYVQVRAVAGDIYSPWSTPVRIEGIATPTLNDETMVKAGSFTAMWNSVPGAYKYDLEAYYCHLTTTAEQFYHVNTDFGFVKETDLGTETDVALEQLPGWFFGAATLEDGYVGIQGAFAYLGYAAQIESPALYLNSSGGKLSVEFKAKNDDSRTGVAVALFNPHNGDFKMVDSYETELSKNWYTVKVSLEGGIDGSILAIIPTRSGNVYVDDLKVWQNLKANVIGQRTAFTASTNKTYLQVTNLKYPEGDFVGYKVRSVGINADQTRWIYSPYTDMRYPYGTTSIEDITVVGLKPEVYISGRTITVTGEGYVNVYDMMGREVATGECNTPLTLPAKGIYIVRTNHSSTKISVR